MSEEPWYRSTKHRWRKQVRTFVRNHLKVSPEKARVLCLPGSQALEITEVYDKLGFLRKNIDCVDRDKVAFESMRRNARNVNHFNLELSTLLNCVTKQYEVVSVDLTGHLTLTLVEALVAATSKRFLTDRSLFLINFFTSRESGEAVALECMTTHLMMLGMKLNRFKYRYIASPKEDPEPQSEHIGLVRTLQRTANDRVWVGSVINDILFGIFDLKVKYYNRLLDILPGRGFIEWVLSPLDVYRKETIDLAKLWMDMMDDLDRRIERLIDNKDGYLVRYVEEWEYRSGRSRMRSTFMDIESIKSAISGHPFGSSRNFLLSMAWFGSSKVHVIETPDQRNEVVEMIKEGKL